MEKTNKKLLNEKKDICYNLFSLECQFPFLKMEEGPNDEFDPEVILDGDKIIDDFLGNLIDDDIVISNVVKEEEPVKEKNVVMNISKFINTLLDDIDIDINSLKDVFRAQLKTINGNTQRNLYKEKKNILESLGSLECKLLFYYMTEKPLPKPPDLIF